MYAYMHTGHDRSVKARHVHVCMQSGHDQSVKGRQSMCMCVCVRVCVYVYVHMQIRHNYSVKGRCVKYVYMKRGHNHSVKGRHGDHDDVSFGPFSFEYFCF